MGALRKVKRQRQRKLMAGNKYIELVNAMSKQIEVYETALRTIHVEVNGHDDAEPDLVERIAREALDAYCKPAEAESCL